MSRLDAYSRIATHHEITIDTKFRTQRISEDEKKVCTCPIPNMRKIADYLFTVKGKTHSYSNDSLILSLEDVRFYPFDEAEKPTHLCLLVNALDKDGSITVVRNNITKKRTEVEPKTQVGEGYDMSSFILISLDGDHRKYEALLTTIPKATTNIIILFLNRMLFEIARDNESDFTASSVTNIKNPKTGRDVKLVYKPVFDFTGKLDQELFRKINKEGLSEVVFVKNVFGTTNIPDSHTGILPIESTLKIHPHNVNMDALPWLKRVGEYLSSEEHGGYETIKIKFKEPDAKSPRQVNLKANDIRLDAIEKTFIKKTEVSGFSSRLKDSYDTIEKEIYEKLIEIM